MDCQAGSCNNSIHHQLPRIGFAAADELDMIHTRFGGGDIYLQRVFRHVQYLAVDDFPAVIVDIKGERRFVTCFFWHNQLENTRVGIGINV